MRVTSVSDKETIELKIELPKWVKGKHIYVFADTELLAYTNFIIEKIPEKREYYTPLKVKVSRCNGCSQCCESGSPFNDEKPCPHLTENGCDLGHNIPFGCARSDCSITFDKCSERFE